MQIYQYEKDADGIVVVTFDAEGKSANTMTRVWIEAMHALVSRLREEPGLTGVVLASAKPTFFAGGDLDEILANDAGPDDLFAYIESIKKPFRDLEKLDVPVVAAINGAALGGGFEMCLACNYRIVLRSDKAVVGLPESQLGLLPGAGGVVRLVAKLGLEAALPLLLEGKQMKPEAALAAGLVDTIVDAQDALIPTAKDRIKGHPDLARQPWDLPDFKFPGGQAEDQHIRTIATMATTMTYSKTRGLAPAPDKIIDIAVNSMRMGFDSALRYESRAFVTVMRSTEAKAAITTFFFGMQAVKSGKMRPEGAPTTVRSSVALGAGMMGAGIAWANASRGIRTKLIDTTVDKAEKGKGYSRGLAAKAIKSKRMTEAQAESLLDCIQPGDTNTIVSGADLIIEAVFEDISLKEETISRTFPQLGDDGIFASNTSTLPISILAEASPDPSRFIGLHFFSPVDKMKIVEIILGQETSHATLRKAYDYVRQIGYTPIIVNDSRGFFTSRVFGTYMDEGLALLRDGVKPVTIERAAWVAGMPVGPLAVHDEVSMVLSKKIRDTHLALDMRIGVTDGYPAEMASSKIVADKMIEIGRGGRKYNGGFYDYQPDGTKSIWTGLDQFAESSRDVPFQDAIDRLLYRQAIETLRCFCEGVIRSEAEANIGSILAIGFPGYTGGALQFLKGIGRQPFERRAGELADRYGERFDVAPDHVDHLFAANALQGA